MSTPSSERRIQRHHLLGFAWLTLISGFVVIDHVTLNRLAPDLQVSAQASETAMLAKLSALDEQFDALTHQPRTVSETSFESAQHALNERLAWVEQAIRDSARTSVLTSVQAHLSALDARVLRLRHTSATAPKPAVPSTAPPAVLAPPFTLLGTELRGGERFLALVPAGIQSLNEVRLLRVGEAQAGWRLESIGRATADFRAEDRLIQVELP